MKATLSFDLTNQDDRTRHLQCVQSNDMAIALWRISQMLFNDLDADEWHENVKNALEDLNIEELCP
jgi:hypothetical protein